MTVTLTSCTAARNVAHLPFDPRYDLLSLPEVPGITRFGSQASYAWAEDAQPNRDIITWGAGTCSVYL